MPTNGNAGAAWALYGARAGLAQHHSHAPGGPRHHRTGNLLAGARLYLVDGLISDAGRQVARRSQGGFDASTLKEPHRIEGKKTIGLEIAEQLGWTLPDVIPTPPAAGGLIGIYKALRELQELGWVRVRCRDWWRCRRAAAPPSSRPGSRGARIALLARFPDPAFGINAQGAGDFLVLDALYRTEGCAVAVDDSAIQRRDPPARRARRQLRLPGRGGRLRRRPPVAGSGLDTGRAGGGVQHRAGIRVP